MTPERQNIPDWAHRERQADLDWIGENLDDFWTAATVALEDAGRGAIVVDTASRPIPGAGCLFGYFSQEQVEENGSQDTMRMVAEYDPTHELILLLLKSGSRTSTYRVQARPSMLEEPRPRLEIPDLKTLVEWEAEGGCEAACLHGCWVEPDGVCTHGKASWLLKLGLI